MNRQYSDYELLALLEENGFSVTYTNLKILKEGLENGSIEIDDEKPLDKEEAKSVVQSYRAADQAEKKPVNDAFMGRITEDAAPEKKDDKIKENPKKEKYNASDIRSNLSAIKAKSLLESYLIEDCQMEPSFVANLTEDVRVDSLKSILSDLLKSIEEKLSGLDTSIADRSRGEITKLKELPEIQDAVTKLEAMLERDEDAEPEYLKAVEIIIRALLNINKYAPDFKEAYRNKKTILIMKYQSLILSVISAISYLLSTIIDYRGGNMTIKANATVDLNVGPIKSLADFNRSVESGEFKKSISDVVIVREYFLEIPTSTMSTVLEASDYLPMIIDGVKNIYRNLDGNGKLVNLIYKAVGIIVLIFSIRDIFYTLSNMKSSVSSMLGNIKLFSGTNENGGVLSKLSQFASSFKNDIEFGDKVGKMEAEDQNRQISKEVRELSARRLEPETPTSNPLTAERKAIGSQVPASQDVGAGVSDFSLDF